MRLNMIASVEVYPSLALMTMTTTLATFAIASNFSTPVKQNFHRWRDIVDPNNLN